jgi:hypothetical protein
MLQLNGIGWQKVEIFGNPKATLPQLGSKPYIIFSSFGSVVHYCKDDICKQQFEDDLVLFITKDLHVLLSYVHFFFKRLLLR